MGPRQRLPYAGALLAALSAKGFEVRDNGGDMVKIVDPEGDVFSIDLVNTIRVGGDKRYFDLVTSILDDLGER